MKKAFTFIELMVVIAIMAILCAIISARVSAYKEESDKEKSIKVENTKTNNAERTTTYTITVISE